MTERFAKDQLKAFIERVERLEEEKKALADDIRDVYAEAKGTGFDTKAMREIVRRRKMDAAERQEQDAILETYMHALGMLGGIVSREDAEPARASRSAACAAISDTIASAPVTDDRENTRSPLVNSSSAQPVLGSHPLEESEHIAPGCVDPEHESSSDDGDRPCPDGADPDTPGGADDPGELPPFLRRDADNLAPFMRVPGEPRAPP